MQRAHRLTVIALLALATTAGAGAAARDPSSYFASKAQPAAKAASAPAAAPASAASAPQPALSLPPPLPAKKGGTTLPPLVLPPLPGFEAETPPTSKPAGDAKTLERPKAKTEPAKPAAAAQEAPAEKDKNSPFLSRTELEQKRKSCKMEYTGASSLTAAAKGEEIKLKFRAVGEPCLSAAAPDEDWLEAAINSPMNEVILTVAANTTAEARTSALSVIAGNQTFALNVKQLGRERGCRRATLRKVSNAPIPEGFQR